MQFSQNDKLSLRAGFEPARGDPIGFQVQRLNHSAIAAPELRISTSCFIIDMAEEQLFAAKTNIVSNFIKLQTLRKR